MPSELNPFHTMRRINKHNDLDHLNLLVQRRILIQRINILLIISEVTENIIEIFTTSEALKNFISENMHHSFFYNKEKMKLIHY